jgi:hypothetical protein
MAFPTFQEYLHALPAHESLLLQQVELLQKDMYAICENLHPQSNVILVSDGGAVDEYSSFGWMLSTLDSTRLAQGSSSMFGFDPRSYRAEGHGAKAGMLFLTHCFQYCNVLIPEGQFTFYCYNKGLLKKLQQLRSYSNAIHSTFLHLEWDILLVH